MSIFSSYEKVHRLEKDECDGIMQGICYIEEKIDGANAQIYLDENKVVYCSRNRVIGIGKELLSNDDFRGLGNWVSANELDLKLFFNRYPNAIVYGEWLVKHTISYPVEYLNNFYAFDIKIDDKFISYECDVWNYWLLNRVPLIKKIENPSFEELRELLLKTKSSFGASFMEGIVVKNYDFYNKYGRQAYGKLLHKDFEEVKSKKKINVDHNELEAEIARRYCTKARVIKICEKIKDSGVEVYKDDKISIEPIKLEMKHIPRVINTTFYDIITEDMFDILKKFAFPVIDFKKLRNLIITEAKKYYIEFLQNDSI